MYFFKASNSFFHMRTYLQLRSVCTYNMYVQQLSKRTILKLTGPDTTGYLQSMITNDIRRIESSPAIYSLLLNSRGKVLYDILLYKINNDEYFVEYDKTAVEYLHKHLFMYRLRKLVDIQVTNEYTPWVVHPEVDKDGDDYLHNLKLLENSLTKKDEIVTSVIDPRTNLLGIRVVTKKDTNLLPFLKQNCFAFTEGKDYRTYRYKLGIGEGVTDHPTGVCLPQSTNVDYLNGVSFSKGCYIGQELTAKLNFTMNTFKRLMPVVLESKDDYPEFAPEATIVNEKNETLGRLRSHLGQFGLAWLKYDHCLKAKYLLLKDYDIKLTTNKPKWWPNNANNG